MLGSTRVLNFHSVTTVSTGFWLLIAAVLVLSAGPWVFRFLRDSWHLFGQPGPGRELSQPEVADAWDDDRWLECSVNFGQTPGRTVVMRATVARPG